MRLPWKRTEVLECFPDVLECFPRSEAGVGKVVYLEYSNIRLR